MSSSRCSAGRRLRGRSRPGRSSRRCLSLVSFAALARALRKAPLAPLRSGLNEAGFVEGQNVAIEYRYADNRNDQLPALIADLIRRQVAVLVMNNSSALVAKSATTTVPIVFARGGDPVRDGLVTNLNRPGGNVTGVVFFSSDLGAKRLDLLRQLVPQATTIAVLTNPGLPNTEAEFEAVQTAAQAIGQQLVIAKAASDRDIESAFATFQQRGAGALHVGAGPFFNSRREALIALAVAIACRQATETARWSLRVA